MNTYTAYCRGCTIDNLEAPSSRDAQIAATKQFQEMKEFKRSRIKEHEVSVVLIMKSCGTPVMNHQALFQ